VNTWALVEHSPMDVLSSLVSHFEFSFENDTLISRSAALYLTLSRYKFYYVLEFVEGR
jgi:hypothetical protein